MVWTVYEATFERSGVSTLFRYVGSTSLSLQGRGANHVALPVYWCRGLKAKTLHLRCYKTCKTEKTALAEEARLAAKLILEDEEHTRGGPWSFSSIMPRHRREMEVVMSCSSAAQVSGQAVPGTPLWKHLHNEPYVQGKPGWTPARIIRKSKKGKLSGAQRLKRDLLTYGTAAYASAKYGIAPADAEARAQRKFNSTRPYRKRGSKRCR